MFFSFILLFALIGCRSEVQPVKVTESHVVNELQAEDVSLKKMMDSLDVGVNEISILIDKSDYLLSVMAGDQLVKAYSIVLGGNPIDAKIMQGDQCTPEGEFHIVDKYPHASWNKFLWIDYPTQESWDNFSKAKENGRIPSDAKIGGEIGIHGVPSGYDYIIEEGQNWTLGCISLTNEDVDEIYPVITKSTLIIIQK